MGYSLELVIILCVIAFIIGSILGLAIVLTSTTRVLKRDRKDFDLFLTKREERVKQLAIEASELKRNY